MFKKYKLRSYNFRLIALITITCIYALMVVNSANSSYTIKQGAGMAAAYLMMIFISFVDYKFITKYYWRWYAIGNILLVLVLLIGKSSHGAKRWLGIGTSFQIQPSEFMKLIIAIFLAKVISMYKDRLNTWKFLVIIALVLLVPILLIVKEPDLSTTVMVVLIVVTIIFCAGISYKIIGMVLLVVVPLIAAFLVYIIATPDPIFMEQYQRNRIVDFIYGSDSTDGTVSAGVYQQNYAVQAIGSGQLSGKGLNNEDPSSLKNAGYIAEAQNDFIFAVIGEELGFVGCLITIFLLFTIVIECIITAVRAKDLEGRLICCGVAAYIAFQTFINIGVVTKLLPNTGLPLPFFSCGVTSLVNLFAAMGIVLNINLQRNVDRDDEIFADDFRG